MAATSINFLAVALKELGWSYTKLIAELRREAAVDGIVLPKTESLIQRISRWVNNHQQPDDFYRDLLSRAIGRPRFQLFGDEAATFILPGPATGRRPLRQPLRQSLRHSIRHRWRTPPIPRARICPGHAPEGEWSERSARCASRD
jgi:hypothetical protein